MASNHRLMAVAVAASLPLLTMTGPVHAAGPVHRPPAPARQRPVPVYPVKPNKVRVPAMHPWHAPATTWPVAGTVTVALARPADRERSARAGSLPVRISPAGQASPGSVTVAMESHSAARAAGLSGVLFTLTPADQAAAGRRVRVSLDYSSFAYADGGDFASRLRLVELPACAAVTPGRPRCRVPTPVAFTNNVREASLSADLTLPGARTMVLAATTSPSGSGGDYTATPLSEAGTWAAGDSSGAFTYSYPIQVPPVPGGLEPSVALNYNSQAVDGLTSSTNGQASWIGDGWNYSPGFIERGYQSCEQKPPGATNWVKSGDQCWSSNDTVTLSLDGQDTTLVQDGTTGTWRAQRDSNEKISYLTGTSNGTHDGGYWVVTAPDGTSYYFGLNQLPGYASGDATTNSAWTLPVFATSSGQPCYNATFSASYCAQAWRWNLDYVTDPHSDAMAYFYQTETNNYSRDNATTADASYIQAGALSTIEYGLRAGSVYGSTPAGKVTFTTGQARTDVPTDLACASGSACNVISPTFWGKFQLTSIGTQALEGSALASVDSWALSQTYPSTGDSTTPASLWLSGVTRTGSDTAGGGTSASLPEVTFAGRALANRVMTQADLNSGYSIITRFRLTSITKETGGVIGVGYDTPGGACTSGAFPPPDTNTDLCYPDYWTPPGSSSPILDWFNKYAVTSVTNENTVGGGVPVQTSYSYSGAAWHYDDNTLTRSSQRTWDQWRGFRTVTTQTGTSPDPVTDSVDTFFQGMDGDYQSNGTTSSVSLSSHSSTVADSTQFFGMSFEHVVYDGAGGAVVSDAVTIPYTSSATATQTQPSPLPALRAFMTGTAQTRTFTPLASGGTRESDVTYAHDSSGRVISSSDVPDTSDSSEDTCTAVTYASNTSAHILNLVAEQRVVSVPCGTTPTLPADAVSDTLTFYDGATSLSSDTPTKGDVTQVKRATSYNGSTPVYTTRSTATYDEYGRALTSTDADGRTTTTSYTPATGAEPTSETVTDPAGLVTTTAYDPARDLPTQVTNPAGYVTSETYSGLGLLTAVWLPGHAKATASADYTFGYSISNTAASVVTTNKLNDTGAYTTSELLYDSLGRPAETQSITPDGGRDITDKYYNSDGLVALESNPYYTTGAPNGTIVGAPDNQVPSQTGYVYDGDVRIVRQIAYKLASETRETDTAFAGNATTVSFKNLVSGQPTGGVTQTTFTDGRGLTSQIYQYHAGVPANPGDPASDFDLTSYSYTPARQLASITDAAGNQWSYGYDLAGDRVSSATPDAGTSNDTYDSAGQLMTATDARGKTISYVYDGDGRKIAEYDTTGGAAETSTDEIASWTYDTKAKGMLTSSSTFYGGQAYTEEVTGYNSFELPSGTETIIPSAAGALAATYQVGRSYDPDTMQPISYFDSAAGGLPSETVKIGYDTAGNPVSLGSASLWTYVTSLSHTEFGQPLEYKLGPTTNEVDLTDSYDQETQRLSGSQVVTVSNNTIVDSTGYSYDNVGDVLSESDAPPGGPAQVQCFTYDYLDRLSQAWSQGSTGCASSPSTTVEGGSAPYWNKYSYDVTNDLTSLTSTQPNGTATTSTGSYPAPGSPQPHAVSSVAVSGAGTSAYGYDPAGHLRSVASPGQSQSLSWDDAGRLSSVTTTPSGGGTPLTTTYMYNADGSLLLQADPDSTTLYLSDEQITLNTTTSPPTLSATRFYSIGGVTIAARTSAGTVDYLFGDRQGTSLLAVSATPPSGSAVQTVTRRYFDPYGNPIGPVPPSMGPSAWPGDKGFVGGTADLATGLTNLGVREYNPATESFISPDPLLTPFDPQDLNPYAYGADSPATNSDPTGAHFCNGDGYCGGGCSYNGHGYTCSAGPAPAPAPPQPVYSGGGGSRWPCPYQICGHYVPGPAPAPAPPPRPRYVSLAGLNIPSPSELKGIESVLAAHPGLGCIGPAVVGSYCPVGQMNAPDYYTLQVQLCVIVCVGLSYSVDRYGQRYFSMSGGFGIGANVGLSPGFISSSKPQFHTPDYVYNYMTGGSEMTGGGVGPVGITSVHGNLNGNSQQDWGYEPSVGVGPSDFDVKFGFYHTWSWTWATNGPWNY